MKRFTYLCCILFAGILSCHWTFAQTEQDIFNQKWIQLYDKGLNEEAQLLIKCPDQSFILVKNQNFSGKQRSVSLQKTDQYGNTVFDKKWPSKGDEDIYHGIINHKGELILTGATWAKGKGKGDLWVVKADQSGTIIWESTFGDKNWESGLHVIQATDENYLLTGYTTSKGNGLRDGWLIKIDDNGQKLWEKTYGGAQFDYLQSILTASDGGYYLSGSTESYGVGGYDYWLIKIDEKGNKQWDKTYGGNKWDLNAALIEGHQGIVLAGRSDSEGSNSADVWLIFLDDQGNEISDKTLGTAHTDKLNQIIQTPYGYLLCYTTYDDRSRSSYSTIARLDKDGNVLNQQRLNHSPFQECRDMALDQSEDILVLGHYKNPSSHQKNIMFLKLEIDPMVKLKDYIQKHLAEWEQKGTYEKMAVYKLRVNARNRKEKIKSLISTALHKFAEGPFLDAMQQAELQYDVESEVFKISLPNIQDYYVKVPVHEAEAFNDSFKKLRFSETDFSIQNGNFVLTKASIFNPTNSKTYLYDHSDPITFYAVEVENSFTSIYQTLESNLFNLSSEVKHKNIKYALRQSDVDNNIPQNTITKPNTFALIIGNENYSTFQKGLEKENDVIFAGNDALIFSEYVEKTLGVPEENISLLLNATVGQMKKEIERISKIAEANGHETELIFYYAGHGLADQHSREAYMIPVDVSGKDLKYAVKLDDLYRQLTRYPSKKVTVILDACFSGGARNGTLLAARGVRIKPKPYQVKGNLVIFASSSSDEISGPYAEQQHGIFTYFLLKKMKESQGRLNYGELASFLSKQVKLKSLLVNESVQTPQVSVSPAVMDQWKNWYFLAPLAE